MLAISSHELAQHIRCKADPNSAKSLQAQVDQQFSIWDFSVLTGLVGTGSKGLVSVALTFRVPLSTIKCGLRSRFPAARLPPSRLGSARFPPRLQQALRRRRRLPPSSSSSAACSPAPTATPSSACRPSPATTGSAICSTVWTPIASPTCSPSASARPRAGCPCPEAACSSPSTASRSTARIPSAARSAQPAMSGPTRPSSTSIRAAISSPTATTASCRSCRSSSSPSRTRRRTSRNSGLRTQRRQALAARPQRRATPLPAGLSRDDLYCCWFGLQHACTGSSIPDGGLNRQATGVPALPLEQAVAARAPGAGRAEPARA